jgi:site-specific recombinase XerD
MARSLPSSALAYLRLRAGDVVIDQVVRRFHNWMYRHQLALTGLGLDDIERFFEKPFGKIIKPRTSKLYKRALIDYLDWLASKDRIAFDPKQLPVRRRRPLPELAEAYSDTLRPTHKKSTIAGARTSLSQFSEWLADNRIALNRLDRTRIEGWLLALSDRGLHPSTRLAEILHVRAYLRWAAERGALRHDADELIRRSDLPKLPRYLPRPIPPEQDRQLLQRLERSMSVYDHGLLLMRWTGLRIGELIRLEYECLRVDHHGNRFVKVPLGKLDSERLVPLDNKAYEIIERLKHGRDPSQSRYLLELVPGRRTNYPDYRAALKAACAGINVPDRVTTHRLRHTYATSLLSAGMSLTSIMKLLGHTDFRMTLRYTAITEPTVIKEYNEALAELERRYELPLAHVVADDDPLKSLADIVRWLQKEAGTLRETRSLIKRLERIGERIQRQIHDQKPGKLTS